MSQCGVRLRRAQRSAGIPARLRGRTGRGVTPRRSRAGAVALRRAIASWGAAVAALIPTVAFAHGNVTGIEDVWQDYGVAIFLTLVVLVGAGVLIWVLLAPLPIEATDDVAPAAGTSNLDEARRVDHEDGRAP